jgi:hypothetical protein
MADGKRRSRPEAEVGIECDRSGVGRSASLEALFAGRTLLGHSSTGSGSPLRRRLSCPASMWMATRAQRAAYFKIMN